MFPIGDEAHVQALATIVASLVVLATGAPAPIGAVAPVSAARHRPPRQATRRRSAAAYR